MTSIKSRIRALRRRRERLTLYGTIAGAFVGPLVTADISIAPFSAIAAGIAMWYATSLSYWEYVESVTLPRRRR